MRNPLCILFAGQSESAHYLDDTSELVFVRALPQRHLHHVLVCAEHKHLLIELVTYKALKEDEPAPEQKDTPYPDIPLPTGYKPVLTGWTDNLTDESIDELYEIAKKLNFTRAVEWAKAQVAAKKTVLPLRQMAMQEVMPMIERIVSPLSKRLEELSAAMPSSPPSPDASTGKRS